MSQSELLSVYLTTDNHNKNSSSYQTENLTLNNHNNKRLFVCSLCNYRTDRRNNLKRHTATMHELSQAVLECCGSRFANKAALRHHTAAYHRHGYICTICSRVFCRRALLRRHHAVHSGYKEFACVYCDYATSHKSNLERHMKIHETSTAATPSPTFSSAMDVDDASNNKSNPILASLLSQPATVTSTSSSNDSGREVIQWIYQSPYDSYSSQVLNLTSSRVKLTTPTCHTIDVILGKHHGTDDAVTTTTTASNHWSMSSCIDTSLSSHEFNSDSDQMMNEPSNDGNNKRQWQLTEVFATSLIARENGVEEEDMAANYVPKKLRMSKRYQSI